MTKKEPIREPEKYNKYEYLVDDRFLDEVLGHMYTTRGTYHTVDQVRADLARAAGKDRRYNDVLMALEKLAKDEYVKYEGEREPAHHVYRLTYDGYIVVKSSNSSSPYQDLIWRKRRTTIMTRSMTIATITNAVAVLVITGFIAYNQFSSDNDANTINRLEQMVADLTKKGEESKEVNMKLELELNAARMLSASSEKEQQERTPPETPKNSTH
jgi:hypothetical protein